MISAEHEIHQVNTMLEDVLASAVTWRQYFCLVAFFAPLPVLCEEYYSTTITMILTILDNWAQRDRLYARVVWEETTEAESEFSWVC